MAKSCPTLCNPMDCSVPGFLVLPYLLELLKLIAIELVVSSNHLILCHPILLLPSILRSFPGDPGGKESACNTGDPGSAPGLGRSPGESHGQRSLEAYSLWGHKESDTTEQLTLSLFKLWILFSRYGGADRSGDNCHWKDRSLHSQIPRGWGTWGSMRVRGCGSQGGKWTRAFVMVSVGRNGQGGYAA